MHKGFFLFSRSITRVGTAKLEWQRNYREKQVPRSIQIIFRRMSANVYRCLALFAENPDYVPLPLAPFGAIASLSSERNAVTKSSALTMNRLAIFQVRQDVRARWSSSSPSLIVRYYLRQGDEAI